MNIIRRIGFTGLLALVALNAVAAGSAPSTPRPKFDVTGTWTATSQGGRGPAMNLVFVLKQEGDKLSGTVSTNGGEPVAIDDARILRTTIYFTVNMAAAARGGPGMGGPPGAGGAPGRGGPGMGGMGGGMGGMGGRSMTTKFTGTPSGDELKFESQMVMPARDGDAPSGGGAGKTELVAKRQ